MIARLLLILALGLCTTSSWSQEQRSIQGRKYIVHTIQPGQTLYAIGRSYAVPVDALVAANPTAAAGLTIGQELLVPMDAVVKKERKVAPVLRNDGELQHTVRKKETLFGIARSYGVDMNALLERNPEATTLREGMTLVIPVQKVSGTSAAALKPAAPDDAVLHVVQPGETLFALGQRYGVDVEVIKAANGGLPDGLKAGSSIRIPGVAEPTKAGPSAKEPDAIAQRYKVAFLLPFAADRNDSALARTEGDAGPKYYEPTRIAVQFYNGARLALDSLERCGLNADVSVLDMGDDPKTWGSITKRTDLLDVDLFIGPFHRTAIEQLARVNMNAHIVCPVPQSNKVILGMPTVSKVTPTRTDLLKHAARYVALKHAHDNIILARPDIAEEKDAQEQTRTALNEALLSRSDRLRDTVLIAKPGRRDLGDLVGKLDASKLNVIVAPSEDVEFVTTLVGKLKPLAAKYRIMLVGLERWTTFGSVAAFDLDLLGFTFAAGSFIDHKAPATKAFVQAYRDAYKTDVDEYGLLGFDVTMYYLKALMTQGADFADHFDQVRTEPLHMGFRMTRTGPENGFRNEHAIMLQQKDLQLFKAP